MTDCCIFNTFAVLSSKIERAERCRLLKSRISETKVVNIGEYFEKKHLNREYGRGVQTDHAAGLDVHMIMLQLEHKYFDLKVKSFRKAINVIQE